MNSQTKPMASGLGLATAAAMVAGAVALPITQTVANVPMPSISSAFTLVGHDHGWDDDDHGWNGSSSSNVPAFSSYDDDDDDHSYGYDDDDDDHHRGFGNIFGMIGNFIQNNQAQVEAFAAGVPTFYLGPVQLGQGVLASAFYNGYNGSATGLSGVWAYVSSQIGDVQAFVKNMVLTVTQLIPSIPLGPVWVGGGRLTNAFFDGYNGSATGLAGIISYVTASLGLQTPPATPAAAVTASKTAAPSAAAVASVPRAAAATVSVATSKAAPRAAKSAAAAPRAAKAAAAAKSAPKAAAASKRAR